MQSQQAGHRCPTPRTTSLYPALNPNQLASVSLRIFLRVYLATCASRVFRALLGAVSTRFLKFSGIQRGERHRWFGNDPEFRRVK